MKNFLRFLLLSPLLVLAAGCCANSANNCNDTLEDSIYFTLNNDPSDAHSFTKAELDTVYLLRYNPLTAGRNYDSIPLTDSLRRRQQQYTPLLAKKFADANPKLSPTNTIVLSNAFPFAPGTTGGKISSYYYSLVIKDRSVKGASTYTFTISQINLKGQYNADGCNTCYKNILKQANVNGKTWGRTETEGIPIPIPISKP